MLYVTMTEKLLKIIFQFTMNYTKRKGSTTQKQHPVPMKEKWQAIDLHQLF